MVGRRGKGGGGRGQGRNKMHKETKCIKNLCRFHKEFTHTVSELKPCGLKSIKGTHYGLAKRFVKPSPVFLTIEIL